MFILFYEVKYLEGHFYRISETIYFTLLLFICLNKCLFIILSNCRLDLSYSISTSQFLLFQLCNMIITAPLNYFLIAWLFK